VEDFATQEIAKIRTLYETTNLRDKLARWHADVDGAFFGWNDAWLDPAFKSWSIVEFLPSIGAPVQIVQGEVDLYGTLKQIEVLQRHCGSAVEAVVLPNIGHAPHREAPDIALAAIAGFCNALLAEHGYDRVCA
jgi:pimeloyl-ACP methyl ester carboxylesterase